MEDAVVGDKRDVEAEGGGRDRAVGVVLALAEGMADAFAVDAKTRIGAHEIGAGVDGLSRCDPGFELAHPTVTPVASKGAVAELSAVWKEMKAGRRPTMIGW